MHLVDQVKVHVSYMCVCVCVYVQVPGHVQVLVCVCVGICVCALYLLVLLVVLLEVIFSHDSLKTLSFDQHLMYREQVSRDIIQQGCRKMFSLFHMGTTSFCELPKAAHYIN